MKKYFNFDIFIFIIFLFSLPSTLVFASTLQTTDGVISNCPFYDSRNVKVNLKTLDAVSSLGSDVSFVADIQNDNSYPIFEASLLVYIYGADGKMYDRFFANTGNLVLPAKSSVATSFSWKVPSFALPGVYMVRTYVYSSKLFNVGGVPSIEGLSAGDAFITLAGDNKNFVSFNKSSLTVNSQLYSSKRSFVLNATESGLLSIKIDHNLDKKTEALVVWKVYAKDSADEKNLVESITEKIDLVPGNSSESKINIQDATASEYEVIGEIKWMDTKSVVSTHIYRTGKSSDTFSLLGLLPSLGDTGSKVFGCIDSKIIKGDETNYPKILSLIAKNQDGKEVLNKSFNIESPVVGFVTKVEEKNFSKLNITATISGKNGKEEARAQIVYNCDDLKNNSCPTNEFTLYLSVIVFISGSVLAFITWKIRRRYFGVPTLVI